MRSLLLFFLALLLPFFSSGQNIPLSDKAQVSVITCGKGPELYALYGHTAIRISDPVQGLDWVYNYGSFDFDTPNFGLKFVKGDLQYFVSVGSFNTFLASYQYDQRSVVEQVLNVSQQKKQALFDRLNSVLNSKERFYTYKFIDRNCTTKVADLLNEVLGERLLEKVGNKEVSYRDIIYPEFDGHFFEQWGTSAILGARLDEKAEKLFLPIELWQSIEKAKYQGEPLVAQNISWLEFPKQELPFSWWNNPFVYAGLLLLIVFLNNDKLTLVYFSILGLIGLFFCIAGWYSYHSEVQWNYNALLINPLLLLLVFFYGRKNAKGIYRISIISIGCCTAYLLLMIGKKHLLIMAPMLVTNLVLLLKFALRNLKKLRLS